MAWDQQGDHTERQSGPIIGLTSSACLPRMVWIVSLLVYGESIWAPNRSVRAKQKSLNCVSISIMSVDRWVFEWIAVDIRLCMRL